LHQFPSLGADLVLMDIRLQGKMDGVEAADIIRREHNIPVVLLTAYADSETIHRAKMTEPFGYIIKPFEERDLKTTIEIALYRHELSRKLMQSEERYRSFFEDDLTGAFVAAADGTVIACNQAFSTLVGLPDTASAVGMNVHSLFTTVEEHDQFFADLYEKRRLKLIETTLRGNDGTPFSVLANVVADFSRQGDVTEIKGYLIDTTERRHLEQQLRQSQKMEAIGRLAGGIAHDFNNLLTVIIGYTSMIKDKVTTGKPVERDLEGIQNAAKKATSLTKQLLAFSKRQILNPTVLNINELLRDLEKILRRLLTEDIVLHLYTETTRPHILIDPSQIEQALINLVVNARDAMPNGGKLDIESRNIVVESPEASINSDVPVGAYVKISVTDTGMGMKPETLSKIFEPFYTTKGGDKGTGLGLSTVFGIVEQSRGYIQVKSEISKGSAFSLLFPVARFEAQEISKVSDAAQAPTGHETILLVEDEDAVRSLVSRLLTMKGYRVYEASNPGEALLICEQHVDEIELLISDIVMPHMDGHGLADRLRALKPTLKILLMSGYPAHTLRDKMHSVPSHPFIQKPFEPNLFIQKVREVLDQG
ncbi:MAG TPA: response regulator, partial [Spirochaetia bacterium]|nr:response regulator [Spirochaetia bacterium]